VRQARSYLARLDAFARAGDGQHDLFARRSRRTDEGAARTREIAERLARLDPDALSPREALDALYELKRIASGT
jgi:DNA mismatch repair protein MutS